MSGTTIATDLRPYEQKKITAAEWHSYHTMIASSLASSRRLNKSTQLESFTDSKTKSSIVFTTEEHAAHPAWVTTVITTENNTLSIEVIGYYAGDQAAFNELFTLYEVMADRMRLKFKKN